MAGGEQRERVLAAVAAADPSLPAAVIAAALDAVVVTPAVLRELASACSADPRALSTGAPATVGRLVSELVARGSSALSEPACVRCRRTGHPLTRSASGGVCARCRRWQLAEACARCEVLKPVAARDGDGRAVCARCSDRPQRRCGRCGRIRRIALRARDGTPDICDGCFRGREATCVSCGRRRPCAFLAEGHPTCQACRPRATAVCVHCGQSRPPTARWPEGPICDPCYTAALRRRGSCTGCGDLRRLIDPPGPAATRCADCAGLPSSHVCIDCGTEDKLYERGRCATCSLRRRTGELLRAGGERIPPTLTPIHAAIVATSTPRSALNWLRKGAGAALLAELAAGTLPASHQALDAHPHQRAADYLRHMLVANEVLPARDEAVVRTERFVADTLAGIDRDGDRRLVQSYATWRVLRRLRRRAERSTRPVTYTRHAHNRVHAAAALLTWLAAGGGSLADAGQADIEQWVATHPAGHDVGDFLTWATEHGHCRPLSVTSRVRRTGPTTDSEQRWASLARLLREDDLDLTDRVAGALLLCYGQQLSRIAAMTTDQVLRRDGAVSLRFGRSEITVPEPLAGLVAQLVDHGRCYVGVGSPASTPWLFPGLLPGRPLTAARLGERLRKLGIYAQAGRRATLTQLAAELPAAVLADLLHIAPTTAVRWMRDAGGDWTRYAAELARERGHTG